MSNRSDLNAHRDRAASAVEDLRRIRRSVPSPTAQHCVDRAIAMYGAADVFLKRALDVVAKGDTDPLDALPAERVA